MPEPALRVMIVECAHCKSAPSVTDSPRCESWIRIFRSKPRLASGATDVAFDPGVITPINNVGSDEGNLPGPGSSFCVQKDAYVIVEAYGVLITMVDVPNFFTARNQLGPFSNLDSCL